MAPLKLGTSQLRQASATIYPHSVHRKASEFDIHRLKKEKHQSVARLTALCLRVDVVLFGGAHRRQQFSDESILKGEEDHWLSPGYLCANGTLRECSWCVQ